MIIRQDQKTDVAEALFSHKLHRSFLRGLPGFMEWDEDDRLAFVAEGIAQARARNLKTEIGIASYAMAAWWMNFGFDAQSAHLSRVLRSSLPEIRRVHMMNEWVSARLGAPNDAEAADRALGATFWQMAPWGKR
ncbi:hypothetical protein [Azospirillum sp. TSO35-2]|uniref:hypothetical protein n=1 Tax=Azospirillum sp. TSO35-2 TaxID=716796 RepID=UPI000D609158|nr:hypothetical protein [Azospirillum sp. TSO35-2]PWC33629.1 hypothetical protein TSO352_24780 [Azospirillum sp. TSO35-2]